jgi:truncated hemoglobin YjbI
MDVTEEQFEDWIEKFRAAFKKLADEAEEKATTEDWERVNALVERLRLGREESK